MTIEAGPAYKAPSPAAIIKSQLGNRFIGVTGAKRFVSCDDGKALRFFIGRNPTGILMIEIALNARDLYDVTYFRRSQSDVSGVKIHSVENDIHVENLTSCIGSVTQLAVRF